MVSIIKSLRRGIKGGGRGDREQEKAMAEGTGIRMGDKGRRKVK